MNGLQPSQRGPQFDPLSITVQVELDHPTGHPDIGSQGDATSQAAGNCRQIDFSVGGDSRTSKRLKPRPCRRYGRRRQHRRETDCAVDIGSPQRCLKLKSLQPQLLRCGGKAKGQLQLINEEPFGVGLGIPHRQLSASQMTRTGKLPVGQVAAGSNGWG